MQTAHIKAFGRSFTVGPRTSRPFLFGYLPLVAVAALYSGYLLVAAVAAQLGIAFGWTLLALLGLSVELTFDRNGAKRAVGLLPGKTRTWFGYSLMLFAIATYFFRGMNFEGGYLLAFALFGLAHRVPKLMSKATTEEFAANSSEAQWPKAISSRHDSGRADITDVRFRERSSGASD
jgi:hypothetical protein